MKIMERGQVTIPVKLRVKYGITASTEIEFVPVKEGILLKKRKESGGRFREVYGILGRQGSSDRIVDEMRGDR